LKFPELFYGLRRPYRAILLYGAPGVGKTFLAKALAAEIEATFFSVQCCELYSRYVGDSEKQIKHLFRVARNNKPSVIFFDEIDSMSSRSDGESENCRRVKTELLV